MLTATAGFRHDSIPTAIDVVRRIGASSGEFVVTATEDLSTLSATSLGGYDVVAFVPRVGHSSDRARDRS
jgi:hypothetical protein